MTKIKDFFNYEKAREFAEKLEGTNAEFIKIVSYRDSFGQTIHSVRWNEYDD